MFLGDNNIQIAIDTSTVSIQIHYGKIVNIKNVLHVFSLKNNLLSMCQGTQNEVSIKFHHTFCSLELFTPKGKLVQLRFPQVDFLYLLCIGFDATPLDTSENNYSCFIVGINKITHETIQWHHRLAHLNIFFYEGNSK